jgi:biopolymer transport protein ExbD
MMRWKILAAIGALAALAAVALPIVTIQVKVDLSPALAAPPKCAPIDIQIGTKEDAAVLLLNGAPTTRQSLLRDISKVRNCTANSTDVLIRSGGAATYREFMAVIGELQRGGYSHQFLTTEGNGSATK